MQLFWGALRLCLHPSIHLCDGEGDDGDDDEDDEEEGRGVRRVCGG